MADSSILREYLVSLGFKIDGPGQKKFDTTLVGLDKKAMSLGKSIIGVGVATQAMVTLFSLQMEKLYYASRLANSTAGSFAALKFAGAQVGVSGEAMANAIVSMNQAIRANPGLIGLLESLGVSTKGRKTPDIFLDFIDATKRYGPEISNQYAAMFGMDAQTLQLLQESSDELRAQMALREQMAKNAGVDMDAAAAAGKEYAKMLRDLKEGFGLLIDSLSLALLPLFKDMAGGAKFLLEDITLIVSKIKTLADLKDLVVGGWKSLWSGAFGGKDAVKPSEAKAAVSQASNVIQGAYESLMKDLGAKKYASTGAGGGRGFVNPDFVPGTTLAKQTRGLRNNNPGNLNYAGQTGASKEGGENGRFAVFGTMGEGLAALERQLMLYAGRGINTISAIVKKYAPSADGNDENAYIKQLMRATGLGANDQIDFSDTKLRSALIKGIVDHENGPGAYSSITQDIKINVTGASSPNETAAAIRDEQVAVNADLVRNLKPRVQ